MTTEVGEPNPSPLVVHFTIPIMYGEGVAHPLGATPADWFDVIADTVTDARIWVNHGRHNVPGLGVDSWCSTYTDGDTWDGYKRRHDGTCVAILAAVYDVADDLEVVR